MIRMTKRSEQKVLQDRNGRWRSSPDPFQDPGGILVWRENGVKDMFDQPTANNDREPLYQAHSFNLKCRKRQGIREREFCIAQNLERQMQPLGHLALVFSRLGAQPKN